MRSDVMAARCYVYMRRGYTPAVLGIWNQVDENGYGFTRVDEQKQRRSRHGIRRQIAQMAGLDVRAGPLGGVGHVGFGIGR